MRLGLTEKGRYAGVFYVICLLFIVITSVIFFFLTRAEPIFKERAADASTQEIRRQIDAISAELMADYDVFEEKSLTDGEISVIELDTAELNSLRTAFSQRLSDALGTTYYTKIYISLGSLFDNAVLQGIGFRIPVRIFFGAISHIDISDKFISAGINQTKYRATLDITVSTSVISAFMSDSRDINVSLPICERIFIGKVPNYYIPGKG
ncbi:MAG: sporulation protein YunB [Clostridia bacterium]|nr:sporulation protein YunB [Clostridia bacterium]